MPDAMSLCKVCEEQCHTSHSYFPGYKAQCYPRDREYLDCYIVLASLLVLYLVVYLNSQYFEGHYWRLLPTKSSQRIFRLTSKYNDKYNF